MLVVAGAYQLTPVKTACLTHCRSPLGFLMTNWRGRAVGAFQMGARHGAYCLGCCWALMGILFVVGVMNLVWVAALSGVVLLEKIGPAGIAVARLAGAAIVLAGILLIGRAI
jgi:predicted metal-binding membrane protein